MSQPFLLILMTNEKAFTSSYGGNIVRIKCVRKSIVLEIVTAKNTYTYKKEIVRIEKTSKKSAKKNEIYFSRNGNETHKTIEIIQQYFSTEFSGEAQNYNHWNKMKRKQNHKKALVLAVLALLLLRGSIDLKFGFTIFLSFFFFC